MGNAAKKFSMERYSLLWDKECSRLLAFSLRVLEYGWAITSVPNPDKGRFNHLYRLHYVMAGRPYYLAGGRRIDLEAGCIVYLPPNMDLSVEESSPEDPIQLMFVNFELGALDRREEFDKFMEELFPYQHLHDKDNYLKAVMIEIQRVGRKNDVGAALEIQNLFENMFLRMMRLSHRYQQPHPGLPVTGSDVLLSNAMGYINANFYRNFRMEEMAAALNVSENYLYKIFVRQTGRAPSTFVADLRMERAKSSLANPNIPIKFIAANLGFSGSSHFSNAFRKAVGISPAAYRRQVLEAVRDTSQQKEER